MIRKLRLGVPRAEYACQQSADGRAPRSHSRLPGRVLSFHPSRLSRQHAHFAPCVQKQRSHPLCPRCLARLDTFWTFKRVSYGEIVGRQITRSQSRIGDVTPGALDAGHPDESWQVLLIVPSIVVIDDVRWDVGMNDIEPARRQGRRVTDVASKIKSEPLTRRQRKAAVGVFVRLDPNQKLVVTAFDAITAGDQLVRSRRQPAVKGSRTASPEPNCGQSVAHVSIMRAARPSA